MTPPQAFISSSSKISTSIIKPQSIHILSYESNPSPHSDSFQDLYLLKHPHTPSLHPRSPPIPISKSSLSSSSRSDHAQTPNRQRRAKVSFVDRPSPLDDDALDLAIRLILETEDRFGLLSNLIRLLEQPLLLATPRLLQPKSHFETELHRRLRHLSVSSMSDQPVSNRWSTKISSSHDDDDDRIKRSSSEVSLLELITESLEVQDLHRSQSKESLILQSQNGLSLDDQDLPPLLSSHHHHHPLSTSSSMISSDQTHPSHLAWLGVGQWIINTISFVPFSLFSVHQSY